MALNETNAVVSILRGVYNPATKQTVPTPVATLTAVPVFMDPAGLSLRMQGLAPVYDMIMLWDTCWDIRSDDQVVGYNPSNSAVPAILIVQQPELDGANTPLACWIAGLKALKS